MDKETARDEIRRAWKQFGEPDRQKKGVVCPFCGNGSGKDGDGIREIPNSGGKLHCFRCDWSGDAVDLIQHASGCSYPEALNKGAAALGLSLDDTEPPRQPKPKPAEKPPADEEPLPDFTDEINRFHRVCDDPTAAAYLKSRGISADIADKYGIRYDPRRRAIIAPFHKNSGYAIRALDPDGFKGNGDGHKNTMFNARALGQSAPVFVTEGWADALSIIEAGGNALALNGTARTPLLDALQRMKKAGCSIPPIILALDDDSAGRGATARTAAELSKSGTFYITGNLYPEGAKDANEALQKDRTAFAAAVARDIGRAKEGAAAYVPPADAMPFESGVEQLEAAKKADKKIMLQRIRPNRARSREAIERGENDCVPTGIDMVDGLLGGGLFPGVTILGGRTGTGKTTLALQMADYIAAQGRPVLYAALEMTRLQLEARSVMRIRNAGRDHAVSAIAYLRGDTDAATRDAEDRYYAWAEQNMYILDAADGPTGEAVLRYAMDIADAAGTAPAVFVDYLQILRAGKNLSDKQAVDANADALIKLAAKLCVPVFCISSFNRASYSETVKDGNKSRPREEKEWYEVYEAALKESGSIEYSATGLLALRVMEWRKEERDMRIYAVKNRWSDSHTSANAVLKPPYGCFDLWSREDAAPYHGPTPFNNGAAMSLEEARARRKARDRE